MEYDGSAYLMKGRWELEDKSRHSINFYRYNEQHQLIEFYREFSDGLTGSIRFEYNEDGKVTLESFARSDAVTGTASFHYSDHGVLERISCKNMRGWFTGDIVVVQHSEDSGSPEKAQIWIKDRQVGDITYTYKKGLLVKEHWDFPGQWWQTFRWQYLPRKTIYTSSNVFIPENSRFHLKREFYRFNQQAGGPSHFEYDPNRKLIEKVFTRMDGLSTKTSFDYSPDGLLDSSIRHYNDGKTGVIDYHWNDDRKLTNRELVVDGVLFSTETYHYSNDGILSEANWDNFDGWITGDITFQCSPHSGLLNKGRFTGVDGMEADLSFSYDSDGNLARIQWEFRSGKTQSYEFEYIDLYQGILLEDFHAE